MASKLLTKIIASKAVMKYWKDVQNAIKLNANIV
jgi:hypothetical protein